MYRATRKEDRPMGALMTKSDATKSHVTKPEQSYVNTPDSESPLDVEPVGGRIGAEVRDIALSRATDDRTIAAIRAALVRHKVLFFRNQQLDDQEHEAFAARL